MGGKSCKNRPRDGDVVSPGPIPIKVDPHYEDALKAYEDECKRNPDLQTIDHRVHEQTIGAINLLSNRFETGVPSLEALMELPEFLLNVNEFAVKDILASKEDVWSKELITLVEAFFTNSLKTLDFCESLKGCLRRIQNRQSVLNLAVEQFESDENGGDERHVKILKGLKEFQKDGNPFDEEFVGLFRDLYEQNLSMFRQLQDQKKRLDKKYKNAKTWKKVTNVIFVTTFASVLVVSVVVASISAPPVVIAMATALAVPIPLVGTWCKKFWNGYLKSVKTEKQLIASMEGRADLTLREFEDIRSLVVKLSIQLDSLLENAKTGIKEQDASMKLVIDEIKKNINGFDETIRKLIAKTEKCFTSVTDARAAIQEKIRQDSNS